VGTCACSTKTSGERSLDYLLRAIAGRREERERADSLALPLTAGKKGHLSLGDGSTTNYLSSMTRAERGTGLDGRGGKNFSQSASEERNEPLTTKPCGGVGRRGSYARSIFSRRKRRGACLRVTGGENVHSLHEKGILCLWG